MSQARLIFEKQWLHALLLAVLLGGLALVSGSAGIRSGQWGGVATPVWFWTAVGLAVAHQTYVWLCWRIELHTSGLSRTLGALTFPVYAVSFSGLGSLRIAAVFIVALANQGTLPADARVLKVIAIIVLIPAMYLLYSVQRYFGFKRAFGVDHFDPAYRSLPFERRGIFRFTRNGMYIYGFLLLWVPAFWWASLAALSVALFNHCYIWVHYFSTERPDIRRIYGETRALG